MNSLFVVTARPYNNFPPGQISLSDPQRTWAQISLTDTVNVEVYDPFSQGGHSYLGTMDLEVGFAGKKSSDTPYDQDQLADYFIKV